MAIRDELDEATHTFLESVFEILRRHPLAEVIAVLNRDDGQALAGGGEKRPVGRPRKHVDLIDRVVVYVRAHPRSGRSEIATGIDADPSDVRRALAKAKSDGLLAIHGARRTARYTAR